MAWQAPLATKLQLDYPPPLAPSVCDPSHIPFSATPSFIPLPLSSFLTPVPTRTLPRDSLQNRVQRRASRNQSTPRPAAAPWARPHGSNDSTESMPEASPFSHEWLVTSDFFFPARPEISLQVWGSRRSRKRVTNTALNRASCGRQPDICISVARALVVEIPFVYLLPVAQRLWVAPLLSLGYHTPIG